MVTSVTGVIWVRSMSGIGAIPSVPAGADDLEFGGQASPGTVDADADRVTGTAQDGGHLAVVQALLGAEREHLALILRQTPQRRGDPGGFAVVLGRKIELR